MELHRNPVWDQSVVQARARLGVVEAPLGPVEQKAWLREPTRRDSLFAEAWSAMKALGLAPIERRLYITHWIVCFLKYPRYWKKDRLDLDVFRLPSNALRDLHGLFLAREYRFEHGEQEALVVPSAVTAFDWEIEGERQTIVGVIDATGFPDPEDTRRLLRSPVANQMRAAWLATRPRLIQHTSGRPSPRRR